MTTTLRKTHIYKKARAISSGFLGLINTFMLTPRQGIADKRTSFRSAIKRHENDHSITICDIAFSRADKSKSAWFIQGEQMGGVSCIITCII